MKAEKSGPHWRAFGVLKPALLQKWREVGRVHFDELTVISPAVENPTAVLKAARQPHRRGRVIAVHQPPRLQPPAQTITLRVLCGLL